MPFILQNCHLHCIRFFPNLDVPSAQAAPKSCVPQYFAIRSFKSLLSIKMSFRALHPLPRSEEARKLAFPDISAAVTQDGAHLGKCLPYLVLPRATWPHPGVDPQLPDTP